MKDPITIDQVFEQLIDRKVDQRLDGLRTPKRLVDLAKTAVPRQTTYRAARAGHIEGAVKINRRWYSPEEGFDKWVASHATLPQRSEVVTSEVDELRARLGLRLVGGGK